GEEVDAGGITARSIEACHQAELDRVITHTEHDRDRRGRSLSRECSGGRAGRGDHAYSTANEIGRQLWQAIISAFRPAIVDRHVLALDVTGVSEALPERGHELGPFSSEGGIDEADHRHRRLLRARRQRPRRRAAKQGDELAAVHSITPTARSSRPIGSSIPNARAALRLTMSENLVGCCTGKSPGLTPLRMRST